MSLNAFARNTEIRGTDWQWVGDTRDGDTRTVVLRAGYKDHEGNWQHLPPVEIDTVGDETQEERFNRFVDTFLGNAKESGS